MTEAVMINLSPKLIPRPPKTLPLDAKVAGWLFLIRGFTGVLIAVIYYRSGYGGEPSPLQLLLSGPLIALGFSAYFARAATFFFISLVCCFAGQGLLHGKAYGWWLFLLTATVFGLFPFWVLYVPSHGSANPLGKVMLGAALAAWSIRLYPYYEPLRWPPPKRQ